MEAIHYGRPKKYPDCVLVECYMRNGSQTLAAAELDVSRETVARAVRRAGIQMTGRDHNGKNQPQKKITDDEIREDIEAGLTRQEIADKHGVHVCNLDRRMHKLGVHANKVDRNGQSVFSRSRQKCTDWHWTPKAAEMVTRTQGGRYELVGILGTRMKMRCKQCGTVFERARSTVKYKNVECDGCRNAKELQKHREMLVCVLNAMIIKQTPRTCLSCGKTFYTAVANQRYCTQKCKAKHKRATHVRARCRKYGVEYNTGISLNQVFIRDGGICQICGEPCRKDDNSWNGFIGPLYPTIDHKVALANGGGHTWDNVQLAHAICNSYKRDLEVS